MKTNKVLFAVILFSISSSFLFAQDALKKGVYNLGGSISYSHSENSQDQSGLPTSSVTSILLSPYFGYFFIDNLSIGASLSFVYYESELEFQNYNSKSFFRQFELGPSIRYYFDGEKVIPFLGASGSYSKSVDSEQDGNVFTFFGGINYFISKSVALEPFLSYSINSLNNPDQTVKTFSVGIRVNYFVIN